MSIEVTNIIKSFNEQPVLKDISLRVDTGELVALLGPSGCGKTTLLRVIAGLELPDSGRIMLHDEDVAKVQAGKRKVGFVFQHYALFRHMTVFENVAFGLRVRRGASRLAKGAIRQKVTKLLQLIQMENLADRYPHQLSGGQRQRVALVRALAVEPKILLLDEPFGSLDARVRQELRTWLRKLHDEIHLTGIFVTHDQEEALEVADRVVVMDQGKIEQVGTPQEVFHNPASEFVMTFLGNVNLFHGRVEDGKITLGQAGSATDTQIITRLFVRPHDFEVSRTPAADNFQAAILRINAAGPNVRLELKSRFNEEFAADISHELARSLNLNAGDTVYVKPRNVRVFPPNHKAD
ncbi:MAG: TOBE-like domain-containing protein [Planctomycetes bacterium]|nr:TOBE-like domain-containing protein [Planctomycetota bacterium]